MTILTETSISEEYRFSAGADYVHLLLRLAGEVGVDMERVFRETRFDESLLEDSGARITLSQLNTLWQKVESLNRDPDMGLKLGQLACNYPSHSLLALYFVAPTVRKAIETLCSHYDIINDMIVPEFFINGSDAVIRLNFRITDYIYTRHMSEGFLSFYASLLSRLTEGRLGLTSVHFTHATPDSTDMHDSVFKAPVSFDNQWNELVFPEKDLELPLYFFNRELFSRLEEQIAEIKKNVLNKNTVSRLVETVIKETYPVFITDIHHVSKTLNISARTLQKRLSAESTSFRKILEQVREKQARHLLLNTDLPLSDLSSILGYAEQSSFTRAFRQWTGVTPGEYRVNCRP